MDLTCSCTSCSICAASRASACPSAARPLQAASWGQGSRDRDRDKTSQSPAAVQVAAVFNSIRTTTTTQLLPLDHTAPAGRAGVETLKLLLDTATARSASSSRRSSSVRAALVATSWAGEGEREGGGRSHRSGQVRARYGLTFSAALESAPNSLTTLASAASTATCRDRFTHMLFRRRKILHTHTYTHIHRLGFGFLVRSDQVRSCHVGVSPDLSVVVVSGDLLLEHQREVFVPQVAEVAPADSPTDRSAKQSTE